MPEEQIESPIEYKPNLENIPAGSNPEHEFRPEQAAEKAIQAAIEKKLEAVPAAQPQAVAKRPVAPLTLEAKCAAQIDQILSDGLEDIYLSLDPKHQRQFRLAGEASVVEINSLLGKAKVKAKNILAIIQRWLKLIPGVNRFFLEQEAKIKTDRILRIKS